MMTSTKGGANSAMEMQKQREMAEGMTMDFVTLTNTSPMNTTGVLVTDVARDESVRIYGLGQLKLNHTYETEHGNRVERISVNQARLGDTTVIEFDPTVITRGTSLIDVISGALASSDLDPMSRLAVVFKEVGRLLAFKRALLDIDNGAPATTSTSTDAVKVAVSTEVGELSHTIAGVNLSITHDTSNNNNEDDGDDDAKTTTKPSGGGGVVVPPGTTYKFALRIKVSPTAKAMDIGRVSGAVKLVMQNLIVAQLQAVVPSFISYQVVYVKQASLFEIWLFFGGDSFMNEQQLRQIREVNVDFSFGTSAQPHTSTATSDTDDQKNHMTVPSVDVACARFGARLEMETTALTFTKSLFNLSSDIDLQVRQAIDVVSLVKDFHAAVHFKGFTQLTSNRHPWGTSIAQTYGDTYVLLQSLLETMEYRVTHSICALFTEHQPSEQTRGKYDKNAELVRSCFESVDSVVFQVGTLRCRCRFDGLRIFSLLPTLADVDRIIDDDAKEQSVNSSLTDTRYGYSIDDVHAFVEEVSEKSIAANTVAGPAFDRIVSWEVIASSNSKNVTVWSGTPEDESLANAVRIRAIFPNIRVADAFHVWYNVELRRSWDDYLTEYQLVEANEDDTWRATLATYWVPPGIQKRDFVEYYMKHTLPNGDICVLGASLARPNDPRCAVRPSHLRSRTVRGGVLWQQVGNDCRVVVLSHQVLGGHLGPMLMGLLNRTGFFNWMKLYREITIRRMKTHPSITTATDDSSSSSSSTNNNKMKKQKKSVVVTAQKPPPPKKKAWWRRQD